MHCRVINQTSVPDFNSVVCLGQNRFVRILIRVDHNKVAVFYFLDNSMVSQPIFMNLSLNPTKISFCVYILRVGIKTEVRGHISELLQLSKFKISIPVLRPADSRENSVGSNLPENAKNGKVIAENFVV